MLRLNVAQQLHDGLEDPLMHEGLAEFFKDKRQEYQEQLLSAVMKPMRDTMKEAQLAGRVKAYEDSLGDLERFAQEQIRSAKGE